MTISENVYNQLFGDSVCARKQVIRVRPTATKTGAPIALSAKTKALIWTEEEHERFLQALEKYPLGPWKHIAAYVGTKTARQTMTHAQKYRQKISRRQRGLKSRSQKKTDENANSSDEMSSAYRAEFLKPLHSDSEISSYSQALEKQKIPYYGHDMNEYTHKNKPALSGLDILVQSATAFEKVMTSKSTTTSPQKVYDSTFPSRSVSIHNTSPQAPRMPPLRMNPLPNASHLPSLAEILRTNRIVEQQ